MESNKPQKRKEKILDWLKDPQNIALLVILLFAIIIRFHYFVLTINQGLWWDEAEYASGAISFVRDVPSGMDATREVIMPIIWGALYWIYPSEILWRFGQLLNSVAIVFLTYLAAKAIFNKKVAIIATAMISTHMLSLFYTGRLLMYTWGEFFFLLVVYLFYEGHVNNRGQKWLYASAIIAAVGTIAYYTTFLAVIVILFFLLLTEGFSFLKNRKILKSSLLGGIILVAYMTFSYIKYGFLHPRLYQAIELAARKTNWAHWQGHFPLFPHLFGTLWIILLVIGMISALRILFILDVLVVKRKSTPQQKGYLFALLWFWFVMLFFTYMAVFGDTAVYEGFIAPMFPAFALLVGLGGVWIYNLLKKHSKYLALLLIVAIVIFGMYAQTKYSDQVIKSSLHSFEELRPAGIWIKEHSNPEDKTYSYSHPQLTYYSERYTTHFRKKFSLGYEVTEENFEQALKDENIRFVVLSPYESPPQWLLEFPQNHPALLTPVYVVPSRDNPQQAMVIVYGVNYG